MKKTVFDNAKLIFEKEKEQQNIHKNSTSINKLSTNNNLTNIVEKSNKHSSFSRNNIKNIKPDDKQSERQNNLPPKPKPKIPLDTSKLMTTYVKNFVKNIPTSNNNRITEGNKNSNMINEPTNVYSKTHSRYLYKKNSSINSNNSNNINSCQNNYNNSTTINDNKNNNNINNISVQTNSTSVTNNANKSILIRKNLNNKDTMTHYINNQNKNNSYQGIKNNEITFGKLQELQKLIKKESFLKELCKFIYI